jgi:argininosuccinate lyase
MAEKLWGGRFKKEINKAADKFLSSLEYDKKLAEYDCQAAISHSKMLAKAGLITSGEKKSLIKGLSAMLSDIRDGKFKFDKAYEDVHTGIQQTLKKKIGAKADKLHIARSRNDLIATETRMFCKVELKKIIAALKNLQKAIIGAAKKHSNAIIPGFTHLRHAQVVLFSHYLMTYTEMIERDKERLRDAARRLDASPLGVGALCGTSLPIDRTLLSKELNFSRVMQHSIDAVSDRDFVIEILSDLAILAVHLSRLSEDFIIFSSEGFNFINIDETFCTGSSMMPHKKNPDTLELIRGESAEICGNLVSALTLMKGLPLSYNRDMQLDKKFLFNSIELIEEELPILENVIRTLKINKEAMARHLRDEFLYATDIAEYLMKKGLSHQEAHQAVGKLVSYCIKKKMNISELDEATLKEFSKKLDLGIIKMLNGPTSVRFKYSIGGTSPTNVSKNIKRWEKKLSTQYKKEG